MTNLGQMVDWPDFVEKKRAILKQCKGQKVTGWGGLGTRNELLGNSGGRPCKRKGERGRNPNGDNEKQRKKRGRREKVNFMNA